MHFLDLTEMRANDVSLWLIDAQFQNIMLIYDLPVSDLGSLARDPSLLMVLMTKFFSRVKLLRPTDSELSITNTMSRAPQRFSQSAEQNNILRV